MMFQTQLYLLLLLPVDDDVFSPAQRHMSVSCQFGVLSARSDKLQTADSEGEEEEEDGTEEEEEELFFTSSYSF
jgi:hypothetical protein